MFDLFFVLKWEILHPLATNPFLHCFEKPYKVSEWPGTSRLNKNNTFKFLDNVAIACIINNNLTLVTVFTNKFFYLIHENGNIVDGLPQMDIWWTNQFEYCRMSNECSKVSFFQKKEYNFKISDKEKITRELYTQWTASLKKRADNAYISDYNYDRFVSRYKNTYEW